jgi:hypothetical protein
MKIINRGEWAWSCAFVALAWLTRICWRSVHLELLVKRRKHDWRHPRQLESPPRRSQRNVTASNVERFRPSYSTLRSAFQEYVDGIGIGTFTDPEQLANCPTAPNTKLMDDPMSEEQSILDHITQEARKEGHIEQSSSHCVQSTHQIQADV